MVRLGEVRHRAMRSGGEGIGEEWFGFNFKNFLRGRDWTGTAWSGT